MRNYIVLGLMFFLIYTPVFASYVLPYPSYMPGHTLYRISRTVDELKRWWYWGKIASAKYHLALSDKYLVEAKTLFEYKQYLLALDALARSDYQFSQITPSPVPGDARNAHREVLIELAGKLPSSFEWQDEHKAPMHLNIAGALTHSLQVRNNE